MLCLALDTTGPACSAALVSGGETIAADSAQIKRGHAEYLGPQVKALLKTAGVSFGDIDRIAVCTGPGSFTGLRVALAFAKGMALPRGTDVVGISALQVWAAMADPKSGKTVLSSADVRRGEFFSQVFDKGVPTGAPKLHDADAGFQAQVKTGNAYGAPHVDPVVLARLGIAADPATALAKPLYHRPPDAKLPGGIDPFAA